ncbi:hypothetical protein [Streptomyces canus]|uniref:hypothetical protein n=1 Tax=Streptomyces canus TaxID=58343 RepID=UPI0027D89DF4|nr:hypothetical protein [Streptomyces canus]
MELIGPDTDGLYTSQLHDWIPLCPELTDSAIRFYWILRSLVIEKRGPVRKLTVRQLAHLLPMKGGRPSSVSRIRGLLRDLSAVGLISTPEGKAVTVSSRANAAARPLRIKIHDKPRAGYSGPRNAFAHLDSIKPAAEHATRAAIEKEALERAARRAGQNSDPLPTDSEAGQNSAPLGQDSAPLGQNFDPHSAVDLRKHDLPFRPSAQTLRSEGGGAVRPSVQVEESGRAHATDGRTDSGGGIEDQGHQSDERKWTPGERLLERIGRHHPEIGAGLAQSTTLRDQARVVDGLLLAGVGQEQVRAVLVDRPYPAPAERTRSMAALIAARLGQIVPPQDFSARPQVPAQAEAPEAVEVPGPTPTMELHRTRRPECPSCGADSPGGDLCGACQGWPACEAGCGRRVHGGGVCPSCSVARPEDGSTEDLGSCPECERPVATAGLCPRCQTRAAAAKKARDADWAAQVAAMASMTDEERPSEAVAARASF